MNLTENEIQELRLVLSAFKAELPSHTLDGWYITSQERETVVVNDANVWDAQPMYDGYVRIRGYATCTRCRQRFEIPSIGNFTVRPDNIEAGIAAAKEWVERGAANGLCWGDVPKPPDHPDYWAVMDVAATQEP